jgi:hypothetical protein
MTLPKTLKPKNKYELIRIGSKNDGGYLCTFNSVKQSATLISLGISTNWEFEKEFLKIKNNKVNFFPVDYNLNLFFIVKSIYKDFGKLFIYFNFRSIFKSIYNFYDYIFFIQKFIKKFTVDYFFLKIDIESS